MKSRVSGKSLWQIMKSNIVNVAAEGKKHELAANYASCNIYLLYSYLLHSIQISILIIKHNYLAYFMLSFFFNLNILRAATLISLFNQLK